MRALVTGGAGFIGSHLVEALLARGDEVQVLDDLSTGRRSNLDAAGTAGLRVGSVDDPETVAAAAQDAEVVFHLAAQIDVRRAVEDPAWDAQVNLVGTVTVLEAARRAGVRRVVMASTGGAIYGDAATVPTSELAPAAPLSPYGASKAAAETYLELYARLHGLSTIALRLANVYGPRQDLRGEAGVIALFCAAAVGARTARIYGDGRQTRDFVFVGDVVEAFLLAGDAADAGPVNVGTGRETTVRELAEALALEPSYEPERAGEVRRSCLDPAHAHARFGWTARTRLREGLERTLAAADARA